MTPKLSRRQFLQALGLGALAQLTPGLPMTTHNDYLYVYRFDGYAPRLHMSVYQPQVLWSGVLDGTPTMPADHLAVTYDSPAPDFAGMGIGGVPGYNCAQIIFRDPTSGRRKGVGRVRDNRTSYTPAATSTTNLNVRTISVAEANLVDGDVFQIVAFYPLETKLPAWQDTPLDWTLSPDNRYQLYESNMPDPVICSGGHWAGWARATASGMLASYTNVGRTYNADPAGGTIGHEYNVTAGTVSVSAPSGYDSSTFHFPPGNHCVQHQAWHVGLGRGAGLESNQNIYLMAHDADHPPHEIILKDYSGDMDKGNNWSVEVTNGAVDEETCPEGAFCVLWADDTFNIGKLFSLRRDVNSFFRSHIIGMGYLHRVSSEFQGGDGYERVTFVIESPIQKLASTTSYPLYFYENTGTLPPTFYNSLWEPLYTLGFKRAIVHTWQFWTTGMDAGIDFIVDDSFDDARFPALALTKSDVVSQMRELANARRGIIVEANRGASFVLQMHPALVELGDRPS